MNPHKVVVGKVQSQGILEISQRLGKGIRQPREPPHLHLHREVLAFVGS